ncbi:hypothetical protein M514_03931 [Trichuris suis]|uniref:Uncharacterized protein n=1 Tax=Trichuris suis TaxID=68888 RepID=A0A085N8W6_9BILA|nr:hypothetical protein M513_03931 [Trichuris suis]KFD65912.1 hypothetical protein M514_03931 [Trichuris suis]
MRVIRSCEGAEPTNLHILDGPEDEFYAAECNCNRCECITLVMIRPFRPFSHEFLHCTIRNRKGDGIFDFSIGSSDFQDDATDTFTVFEDSGEEEL